MALPHPPRRALAVSKSSCCTRGCIAGIPAWQHSAARQPPDHGACHGRLQNGEHTAHRGGGGGAALALGAFLMQPPTPCHPQFRLGSKQAILLLVLLCSLGRTALPLSEHPTALGHSAPIEQNANPQLAVRGLVLIPGSAPCAGGSCLGQKGVLQPSNSLRYSPCFWGGNRMAEAERGWQC